MKRGDVVVGVFSGDSGKPRPALVVQSDFLNTTHPSIVLCQISSHLTDAPDLRITIEPTVGNGLKKTSQVMADKLIAVRTDKVGKVIGRLKTDQIRAVDEALRLILDLPS